MPTNYKIEVHVKIVPSAEPTEEAPRQGEDGNWEWVVSEQTAESIDESTAKTTSPRKAQSSRRKT